MTARRLRLDVRGPRLPAGLEAPARGGPRGAGKRSCLSLPPSWDRRSHCLGRLKSPICTINVYMGDMSAYTTCHGHGAVQLLSGVGQLKSVLELKMKPPPNTFLRLHLSPWIDFM